MTCKEWLQGFMAGNGPMLCKYVSDSARAADFTRTELREARKALGVRTTRDEDVWYWELT